MKTIITILILFSIQLFAGIGIGYSTVGVLPVELSLFISNVNGRTISLSWETKTEKNSSRFEIERLFILDNKWEGIGSVNASVLSNSPKQYSYSDNNLQAGKYQYRLKMIDNDGSSSYSKIIESSVELPKNFELSQNYPNPFNPSTKIIYSIPLDSKVILEVFSASGERIEQLVNKYQPAGFYSINFGSSSTNKNVSSGVYFYRIIAIDITKGNQFSSIKKMMLLK